MTDLRAADIARILKLETQLAEAQRVCTGATDEVLALRAQLAAVTAEREEARATTRDGERERLAQWMIANGFATGHGDTVASLHQELSLQITKLRTERDNHKSGVAEAGRRWLEARAEVDAGNKALAWEPREQFEDAAFNQRFLSGVKRTGTGQFPFEVDCPTQAQFVERNDKGEYLEQSLNPAWWAWQKASQSAQATARREQWKADCKALLENSDFWRAADYLREHGPAKGGRND